MHTIAYLVSANVLAHRAEARSDAHEFTEQFAAIDAPCRAAGFALEPVVWDEGFDPAAYDAVIIGPTWDYWDKTQRFLAMLDTVSQVRPLLNPAGVIRWNMDKTYLRDLGTLGAPVIETVWAERATPELISAAFDTLNSDDLVIKPVVGAGAWRQARVRRGEPLPPVSELPPERAMIQAFLPAIQEEGEYSLLFFGGEFSHAVIKRAAKGDYRIQGMYGGVDTPYEPSVTDIALARQCLEAACRHCGVETLLYARVDMVRGGEGDLRLMEIELIEPYYYPRGAAKCGPFFAQGLARLLASAG
ncbi:MAG: ATP-grasp domain-containing protein [Caulobacterales bacterium]|uniref:ATP-grasp domain-containing protein n=1 Tax=Glycocaulis sp. TaxID=1969725 RepID=UPI003FA13058